jgi:hypothetical protein
VRRDTEAELVRATDRVADELRRAREGREAARKATERAPGLPPLRRLFGTERGAVALLRSVPGFASLWEREVPEDYLIETQSRDSERWTIVLCVCRQEIALRPGHIGDCSCGRFFFHVGRSIRVKRFELEQSAQGERLTA